MNPWTLIGWFIVGSLATGVAIGVVGTSLGLLGQAVTTRKIRKIMHDEEQKKV